MITDKTKKQDLTDSKDYYFCVYDKDLNIISKSEYNKPNHSGLHIATMHNAFKASTWKELKDEIEKRKLIS